MSSPSKSKVYFFFQTRRFSLKNRSALKKFIEGIFKKEHKKIKQISYIFCSDNFLLKINQKYLGKSYHTDIISFDLSEKKNLLWAEIYISIPRIRENAKNHTISFKSELYRVVIHGSLHFCGYNDKKKSDATLMRKKEDHYLSSFIKRGPLLNNLRFT